MLMERPIYKRTNAINIPVKNYTEIGSDARKNVNYGHHIDTTNVSKEKDSKTHIFHTATTNRLAAMIAS